MCYLAVAIPINILTPLTESGLKDKTVIIISKRNQSAIDTYGNNIIAKGRVTIRTSADYTNGIYAEDHKVQLGANSHLTIKGAFSRGIFSTHGTIVLNDNSHITTKGTESIGLEAINASQVVIGEQFALSTNGANAHGNIIADNSHLSLGQQAHIITRGIEAIASSTIGSSPSLAIRPILKPLVSWRPGYLPPLKVRSHLVMILK